MKRFFQLVERDPAVAAHLVSHIVSLACAMEIDPSRPLEFPLLLGARPALIPLWTKVLVIGADRAKPLQHRGALDGRRAHAKVRRLCGRKAVPRGYVGP
ncbi:hypothetical protein ACVWZK_001668 [Bradyrhizobium sp. GM0.4]